MCINPRSPGRFGLSLGWFGFGLVWFGLVGYSRETQNEMYIYLQVHLWMGHTLEGDKVSGFHKTEFHLRLSLFRKDFCLICHISSFVFFLQC